MNKPNSTADTLPLHGGWMLEVTDLKQYAYCPRVVFYRYCLPTLRPTTFKMEEGTAVHGREAEREGRRGPTIYAVEQAEKLQGVRLASPTLHLSGRLDLVLPADSGTGREAIPVDYKNGRQVRPNWKQQLAAYALLLEEQWRVPVRRGVLYLIPMRRSVEVRLGAREKGAVRGLLSDIAAMIQQEMMPPPPTSKGRCVDCEFRRFCNDVL